MRVRHLIHYAIHFICTSLKILLFFNLLCSYYEAVIDEILEDGSCTVTFEEYGNTDVTEVRHHNLLHLMGVCTLVREGMLPKLFCQPCLLESVSKKRLLKKWQKMYEVCPFPLTHLKKKAVTLRRYT